MRQWRGEWGNPWTRSWKRPGLQSWPSHWLATWLWVSCPCWTLISQVLLGYKILFSQHNRKTCIYFISQTCPPMATSIFFFFWRSRWHTNNSRSSHVWCSTVIPPVWTVILICYLSWWIKRDFVLELLVRIRFLCSWPTYLPHNYVNRFFFLTLRDINGDSGLLLLKYTYKCP